MRWLGILALVGLTGCALFQVKFPDIQEDPLNRNHTGIACVARYLQLNPETQVGYDGCGNVWQKDMTTEKCSILSADGTRMIEINCPASGDTLSWIPGGDRR